MDAGRISENMDSGGVPTAFTIVAAVSIDSISCSYIMTYMKHMYNNVYP